MIEVSCAMVVLEQSTISRCLLVQKKNRTGWELGYS